MEIWLKCGDDAVQIPILPPSFMIGMEYLHQRVNVQTRGEISIIGKRALRTFEMTSFFPAHDYSFAEYPKDREPRDYTIKIGSWAEKPVRLIVTDGANINKLFLIQSFSHGYTDGSGDLEYTLALVEYKPPKYKKPYDSSIENARLETDENNTGSKDSARMFRETPKTYTIKSTKDSLKSISKKVYGTSAGWKKIYNANKSAIEKMAKKKGYTSSSVKGIVGARLFPGTKLVIPA